MTPRQKELVQLSFQQIKPIAPIAASLFYGRLFSLDPKLQRLFSGDLEEQGRKLMQMIGLAVKGLNRFEELMTLLSELGARHAGYGVCERDYETVGSALIWTLEQGLGTAFTAEVRAAWIALYELFAETMRAGARRALIVTAVGTTAKAKLKHMQTGKWHGHHTRLSTLETRLSLSEAITGRFARIPVLLAVTLFLVTG